MSYYIGVDIGASTVKIGLYHTEKGIIGTRADYPGRANEGPAATMRVIKNGVDTMLRENGVEYSQLAGAGACCPTPINLEGMCVYPTNIDDSWLGVNVKELLAKTLSVPTVLLNDGDAAAYREYLVRKAAGRDSILMAQLITGTGLGGAIIIDGEILVGPSVASELGHIPTDSSPDADGCGCGGKGCAEGRSSLMGLRNIVRRMKERPDLPEELKGDPMEAAKKLRRLVQQDSPHPAVTEIWKIYFNNLGTLSRIVANAVGCDLIVISGGAHEREDGVSDKAYRRYLDDGIRWIRENLDCAFPHLKEVKVEWAIDEIPDSAAYGTAQYTAVHLR